MPVRVKEILSSAEQVNDTITLDETDRRRRRIVLTSDNGISFLIDFPKARLLRHGECLLLEDGRIIEVVAKNEELLRVSGRDAQHMMQLCWQIGNRHLAAQIEADHLFIRHDPVIRDMLVGLGATVSETEGPFNPEGGAYEHHHRH